MQPHRQGEIYIFLSSLLWGLFPVITILSLNSLPPLTSLAWGTLCATVFFVLVVSIRKKWHEITHTAALIDVLWNVFFVGVLVYAFIYFGSKNTSAGNIGIILQTEVLFSFVFFHVWRKDFLPSKHILGALLVLTGVILVLAPGFSNFQRGDIFILLGVSFAPIGNFFNQRARKRIGSETIMLIRSALSVPILFIIAYFLGEKSSMVSVSESLKYILITGVLLLGLSKIFWTEGIHRISITKANALQGVTPLVTLFFAWLILRDTPTPWQLLSLLPIFVGIRFLGSQVDPKTVINK